MTNENKALDQNLDETVYIDAALDLIRMFKGKKPSDDAIGNRANISQLNQDTLQDTVETKFNNLQQIKKSLNKNEEVERGIPARNQVAFEEIHRFLFDLMSNAIHACGGYSKSLSYIEESLTVHEFFTIEAFYKWIEAGEIIGKEPHQTNSRAFGYGNYNERYKEWLATLKGKVKS